MKYSDFVLQFHQAVGSEYRVTVTSPCGDDRDSFRLPFKDARPLTILNSLTRREAHVESKDVDLYSPETIGGQLFQALFSGRIGRLYERSRGKFEDTAGHGLRLKMKLNLRDPGLESIHSLPWELLYLEEKQKFLGLSRDTSIVRYLDVPRPVVVKPQPSPMHVLVAMSSPPELPGLDSAKERTSIEKALADVRGVELTFLEDLSLSSLREAMLERACHVLHFIGHGRFETPEGRGVLDFDEGGRAQSVPGTALANVLSDFDDLQVVVVNACNTGRSGQLSPFAGVATALLMGGVSSVVAMQFPISDRAAIRFSGAFYRRLAAGDPLDAAVTEGRHGIHGADCESAEWVAPVLFQRIPDGQVWRPLAAENPDIERGVKPAQRRWKRPSLPGRLTRAAILAIAALGVWFLLRLEEVKPDEVAVLILTDETVREVPELSEIASYPISLAALAKLVDAVVAHKPSIIGLDISLAQGEESEARALAQSLRQAQNGFVLASSDDEPPMKVLRETCQFLADGCEEASVEIIEGPFTIGSRLSSENRPFFLALHESLPPPFASEVILPIDAMWRVSEALVKLPATALMAGKGHTEVYRKVVVIGGIFKNRDQIREKDEVIVDRHFLFVPWGRELSGGEIQALLTAYALKGGLLWVMDYRYPLALLIPVILAGWRWPSIHGWFAGLYLLLALLLRIARPVVLPLWPFWVAIAIDIWRWRRL